MTVNEQTKETETKIRDTHSRKDSPRSSWRLHPDPAGLEMLRALNDAALTECISFKSSNMHFLHDDSLHELAVREQFPCITEP